MMAPRAGPRPRPDERIRWVRYAAACADHVLPLTGLARPETSRVIVAVRLWADEPVDSNYREVFDAYTALDKHTPSSPAAYSAVAAALCAASAALFPNDSKSSAITAEHSAINAVSSAEREWQAQQRWFADLASSEGMG